MTSLCGGGGAHVAHVLTTGSFGTWSKTAKGRAGRTNGRKAPLSLFLPHFEVGFVGVTHRVTLTSLTVKLNGRKVREHVFLIYSVSQPLVLGSRRTF